MRRARQPRNRPREVEGLVLIAGDQTPERSRRILLHALRAADTVFIVTTADAAGDVAGASVGEKVFFVGASPAAAEEWRKYALTNSRANVHVIGGPDARDR